ncbi:MAG: MerR family transcriptional regulator [Microbacteriaceae bacterium]|nr:MerR family transcriptional regulator [Microbacteriaceae bacterium]MCL2793907.1 MerR family transcriptional regulator [Microbacteriaceae bacterium]
MATVDVDQDTPLFAIAAAAELAELHPQTLRQYDRLGLVEPKRTAGKSRRYSLRDIAQLREIARLSAEGVSLEGIRRVLSLENEVRSLQGRVRELESALADALLARQGRMVFASDAAGEVVPLRPGTRTQRRDQLVVWRPWGSEG